MSLAIDHLYTLVPDRARAASALRGWGFELTEAGVHSGRGTSNHLAVFGGPYWELLALDEPLPVNQHLQTLLTSGAGLLGCALATTDIEGDSAELRKRGIEVGDAQDVARPLRVGDEDYIARFRVAQIQPLPSFAGHFFFCQHLTPQLVWPTPLPAHPNGATEIAGLTVVGPDPRSTAENLARLLGRKTDGRGGCVTDAGGLALRCVNPEQFARDHPETQWQFGDVARFAEIELRGPAPGRSAYDPSLGRMIVTWRAH